MSMKTVSAGVIAAASLLLVGAANAAIDPATVKAGSYVVDPDHTEVLFNVDHLGITNYYGQFSGVSGTLTIDPSAPAASSVSISLPTASITAPNEKLTGELRSPMFLNAAAFPTVTFVSKQVTLTSPTSAIIVGDLTLHGVTHTITLNATLHGAGVHPMTKKYNVGFDATGHFKRSDFGVSTYLGMLGDDVEVTIAAAFSKN